MKTGISLMIIFLFLGNFAMAQVKALKITKPGTNKELVLKENKRVRLRTNDGEKIIGRIHFEGDNILLNERRFRLDEIARIKKDPLVISFLTSGLLIYGGSLTMGFSAIIGIFIEPAAFLMIIPGAGMVYAGIKTPNFFKNYNSDKGWQFEIIEVPK